MYRITVWSISGLLFGCLFLFFLSYKASKLADFTIFVFVEIISVSFAISDLKEIIIESLFDDADFGCSLVKLIMDNFSGLTWESSVKFTPEGNFFNDLSNGFLFLFGAFFVIVIVIVRFSEFL